MFEKVNPMHPDKVADRIAGALVDLAYKKAKDPKIAVEVLIGHGKAFIIAETSEQFKDYEVKRIVSRIANIFSVTYVEVPQDVHLASNQAGKIRCGDNGLSQGFDKVINRPLQDMQFSSDNREFSRAQLILSIYDKIARLSENFCLIGIKVKMTLLLST